MRALRAPRAPGGESPGSPCPELPGCRRPLASRCRARERRDVASDVGALVAPDRPRRAGNRPQCEPPPSSPHDSTGAPLPRRFIACSARARFGPDLERQRAAGEASCAGSLLRLRNRRASVGVERAGSPARPQDGGGQPRPAGCDVCAEGEPPAGRGGQAPSLDRRVPDAERELVRSRLPRRQGEQGRN